MTTTTENAVPVVLIEDDVPYRGYIAALLTGTGRIRVAAEASSADDGLKAVAAQQPRVVLLDLQLPDRLGETIIAPLLQAAPESRVVVLSGRDGDETVLAAIRAGACGYLLKGASSAEVVEAIDDALAGGAPMSPAIARKVVHLLRTAPAESATTTGMAVLTAREREVLELVANGASDKDAAARLGLARSTVKNVLQAIYGKWRVRSRTEAAAKFFKQAGV